MYWWQLMLERMWGKENTPALLVGVQTGITLLGISMVTFQKIRKQPSSRLSNTTFGYIPKGCSIIPQGHVLTHVHSSIFCHNQNEETTWMALNQRMDNENVGLIFLICKMELLKHPLWNYWEILICVNICI